MVVHVYVFPICVSFGNEIKFCLHSFRLDNACVKWNM